MIAGLAMVWDIHTVLCVKILGVVFSVKMVLKNVHIVLGARFGMVKSM